MYTRSILKCFSVNIPIRRLMFTNFYIAKFIIYSALSSLFIDITYHVVINLLKRVLFILLHTYNYIITHEYNNINTMTYTYFMLIYQIRVSILQVVEEFQFERLHYLCLELKYQCKRIFLLKHDQLIKANDKLFSLDLQ